jgi:primosomal protein N' (replication factor Y)
MSYVQVAVNLPLESGIFDYHLPPELEGQALPGCLVVVPFGKQEVQAILLRQVEVPQVAETRQVLALLNPQPALTPYQINLAEWLSREYLAPLAECIHLMLPPGLSQVADTLYSPVEPPPGNPALLAPLARQILGLLAKRGPLRGRQIENGLPRMEWRPTAQKLARSGWLLTQPVLPPPGVRPKVVRTAQLAASLKELENIQLPGRDVTHPRRRAILAFLQKEANPVPVQWVYATSGGKLGDLEALAETGLLLLGETELWRDPLADLPQEVYAAPPLTPDQQQVWQVVLSALQNTQPGTSRPPVLLQGVTGSGKTEIYLRAVEETLRQGRQAVVLVPEISLTPQTLRRFTGRFPGQVGLVHSRLSPGERYDTWRRARMGRLPVILGPRSALFTPLPDLGLVVVDEFDDDSYTQSDFRPAYSAVQTAIHYCRLAGAVCLLGSATPDIGLLHTGAWPAPAHSGTPQGD